MLLFGLGAVACLPLVLCGFPYPAHDAVLHLGRSRQFSAEFWVGSLYPRWLAGISHGFGSPTFFYHPPMPYWASSVFAPLAAACGGQGADWRALGWASGVGVVLSGQTAFFCFRTLTSPGRAFAAGLAYMIAPYHLSVDLLQRAAYPEFWAFAWMPLALGGLIGLAKNRRWAWEITVCGLALLYMTHLPTTLTFMPFVLLFALSQGARVFARACSAIAAACGVAAVFLVPALTTECAVNLRRHPFPYKLTFFFPNLDVRAPLYSMGGFNERLLWIFLLLAGAWLLCYATGLARRLTWAAGRDQMVWLGLGLVALVMMLPISNFVYKLIPVFQWIQFSWRFLAPATLVFCVLILVFWPGIDPSAVGWMAHATALSAMAVMGLYMAVIQYGRTCLALPACVGADARNGICNGPRASQRPVKRPPGLRRTRPARRSNTKRNDPYETHPESDRYPAAAAFGMLRTLRAKAPDSGALQRLRHSPRAWGFAERLECDAIRRFGFRPKRSLPRSAVRYREGLWTELGCRQSANRTPSRVHAARTADRHRRHCHSRGAAFAPAGPGQGAGQVHLLPQQQPPAHAGLAVLRE